MTAIAIVHFLVGTGWMFIGGLLLMLGNVAFALQADDGDAATGARDLGFMGMVSALPLATSALCFVTGTGVLIRKQWGRILSVVLGLLVGALATWIIALGWPKTALLLFSYTIATVPILFFQQYASEFKRVPSRDTD